MPTYEYQCIDCGYRVDYFQRMSEPARTECPQCKGSLTRMVTGGAGLIFKGSGFYITDYKKHGDNGDSRKPAAASSRDDPAKPATDKTPGAAETSPKEASAE